MAYNVYDFIKEMRIKRGLTQKELGQRLGLTQQAMALIESGKRKIDTDLFGKIFFILDISVGDFFALEDSAHDSFLEAMRTFSAAHGKEKTISFSSYEFSDEELEQIKKYADFLRSQRPVSDLPEEE